MLVYLPKPKGTGKRGHIVSDTLLLMMFPCARKLGNICCGHKMFLNKIRKIFVYMHQEFWTSCWIAQHCGLAGSEKWASNCSFAILDYIEWLGSRCEELPFEPNYKCRNKEKPNQRYFKGKLSFISSWQRHFNDFRQQSVVEIGYEHEFCLFDTRTYVVFLLM